MKISNKTKKEISNRTFTYEDLKRWDAYVILEEASARLKAYHSKKLGVQQVKKETDFRAWIGMEKKNTAGVKDIFKARINPHFKLWTVLRTDLIPANILHDIALHFCVEFHEKLKEEGTYIDFKYQPMLEAKKQWINQKISEGQLKYHQRHASSLLAQIHQANDLKMTAVAMASSAVLNNDPRQAVLGVFNAINTMSNVKIENKRRLDVIIDILQ